MQGSKSIASLGSGSIHPRPLLSLGDKPGKKKQELFDVCLITKHIFIGDKNVSLNRQQLLRLHIKNILVAGSELQVKYPGQFNYLKLDMKDSIKENIHRFLEDSFDFIRQAVDRNQNILIHCAYGVSRSPALAIAYLMKKFKMSFEEAFHFVKQRRPQIKPNEGFRQQLKNLDLYSK